MSDSTRLLIDRLRNAEKFQKDGLWGVRSADGEILLEAKYDQIEFCADFVYAHSGNGYYLFDNNGCSESGPDDDSDYRFYENGKIGLKDKNGNVIFPAMYDEIIDWGEDCDVVYVRSGKEYHYFTHGLKEILTDHTVIPQDEYPLCPYNLGEDQCRNVLLCVEPVSEITGSMDCFAYRQPVRLSRILRKDVQSLFGCCDTVAMPQTAIDDFMAPGTYIYSARRARSTADLPASDCIRKIASLGCYDSSWNYLVRITSNRRTRLSLKDLYDVITHFEDIYLVCSYHIAIGHDDSLKDGEVEVLQIHYFRDDGPGFLADEFMQQILPKGSVRKVRNALKKMDPDERKEQLSSAYWWVKYSDKRDWPSTEKVLEYLNSLGCDNYTQLLEKNIEFNPYWLEHLTPEGIEFKKNIWLWALGKGANMNRISDKQTYLDKWLSKVKDTKRWNKKNREMAERLEWVKQFAEWLKEHGALSAEQERNRMKDIVPTLSVTELLRMSR